MRTIVRRGLHALAWTAVATAVMVSALAFWLLRDPVPRFAERRSTLDEVSESAPERRNGAVFRRARLRAESGLQVDVLVRTPATVEADRRAIATDGSGRRPLFLILGGYRTAERAVLLVEDARGAVVGAMGYPYDGPLDLDGLEVLTHLPRIREAVLDTPPAIQLALDYLVSLPEVDPTRVELMGVSLGAFFAPTAAALDPRVTRLWLVHGAADPRAVLDHSLESSIGKAFPRALVAAAANVIFAGSRLDPARWLSQVSPRPVVMINARDDTRLPDRAVRALHASAHPPSEVIWMAGDHVHPRRPDLIGDLLDVVLDHFTDETGVGSMGLPTR